MSAGANPADRDFRALLLGVMDGQPPEQNALDADLAPGALIGRRVRVRRGLLEPQAILLGRVEGIDMVLSAQALAHPYTSNRPGDVKHTTVIIRLDDGEEIRVGFEAVEFVEENFSETAKGGQHAPSKEIRSPE